MSPKSRRTVIGIACVAAAQLAAARPGLAKSFTLPELIQLAHRGNLGVQAGTVAADAMDLLALEAKRNWLPSGDLTSFVTAVPNIRCQVAQADGSRIDSTPENCLTTNINPTPNFESYITNHKGVWIRTDEKLIQPLWDFGKISAGTAAAEAGASARRQKQRATGGDVELNVTKAYWGGKLARDLL